MFGVKPVALPYVDGGQSDKGKDYHSYKPRQLTQDDGEKDEAEKRHTDGDGSKGQKPTSDTHELQRFLYAFVYRIEIFHRSIKLRWKPDTKLMVRLPPVDYLKKSGSASDIAIKATQPPMVSMMVFFTSWSPFCILKYTLNAPTSTMTAAMAFIRLDTGV